MRRFQGDHLWECATCCFSREGHLCLSAGLNFVTLWHRNVDEALLTFSCEGLVTSAKFLPENENFIVVTVNSECGL